MHHPAKPKTACAALTFEITQGADGVATDAHLLPVGPFRSTDVRPVDCAAWQLDAAIAARVIARAAGLKNDFLIDYEHQSLRAAQNGKPVPAAGWFKGSNLQWRDPSTDSGQAGLFATGIRWVDEAKQMIAELKYRYISAVFFYNPATGEVMEIVSVALTNTPGVDGLEALAALARDLSVYNPEEGDVEMEKKLAELTAQNNGLSTQMAALTTANTGLTSQLAALTAERDGLSAKVAAAETEKVAAALAAEKTQHAALMTAALTGGRLTPAQKPWAEKQSFAALTEYLDVTSPLTMLTKQAGEHEAAGAQGLSEVELAMCTRLGVTPEAFKLNKGK